MSKKLFFWLAVVSVFFVLLFSSLFSQLYSIKYYDKEYQRYGIYSIFDKQAAINATQNMIGFFSSKNNLDTLFFKENERAHLLDVKNLIAKANITFYASIAVFWIFIITAYLTKKKEFAKSLGKLFYYSGIFSMAILIICSLTYYFSGFDFLFIKFHEVFFTGNYAFDPKVSNMKALFPDEFFFDMSGSIFLLTALKSLMLLGIGAYDLAKLKHPRIIIPKLLII